MSELTAENIVDLATPQELDISPDGRWVAYALVPASNREEHPASAIWVAPLGGSVHSRQFTTGEGDDRQPRWSPDGGAIAFLSDRAKRGTAQLYVVPSDGGEARAWLPSANEKPVTRFAWSPDSTAIAFLSADEPTDEDERRKRDRDDADVYGAHWPFARIRVLTLATGEVSALTDGSRHVTELAWSPEGSEIAYLTQAAPPLEYSAYGMSIATIGSGGGEPRPVCSFPSQLTHLVWSSDGQTLLVTAGVSGHNQSSGAVYGVSARGGEPRLLALGEENCAADLAQPPHAARAVVSVYTGLSTAFNWLDPATGALAPLLLPADAEHAVGWDAWAVRRLTSGATVLAVAQSASTTPSEVWAGETHGDGGQIAALRQISRHQSGWAERTFGAQEPFTWTAPDGWPMDGLLVRPVDAPTDHPLPTVVLVHGGPYGRWGHGFHLRWADWAQWLALAGFAVLMPNPRGGCGHGETFAAAARGDVGGADFADVLSAVDTAIARQIADPERLGIGGWSQGGFMSAWAVTQTARFKAAIMGAGVSDWGMMAMTSDVPEFERELGGSAPWEGSGPHRAAQLSPISFARNVRTPVLILHGQQDERVPVSQAIGFQRALREYGVDCDLVTYPREPHGIRERAHQIDVLTRVRDWYVRWLRV